MPACHFWPTCHPRLGTPGWPCRNEFHWLPGTPVFCHVFGLIDVLASASQSLALPAQSPSVQAPDLLAAAVLLLTVLAFSIACRFVQSPHTADFNVAVGSLDRCQRLIGQANGLCLSYTGPFHDLRVEFLVGQETRWIALKHFVKLILEQMLGSSRCRVGDFRGQNSIGAPVYGVERSF